MKTKLECISCCFEQALRSGRRLSKDENVIKRLAGDIGLTLQDLSLENPPSEARRLVLRRTAEITGKRGLFSLEKRRAIYASLDHYPALRERIAESNDPLRSVLNLALMANKLDCTNKTDITDDDVIAQAFAAEASLADYDRFTAAVEQTDEVVFLGDKADEIVYDRLLIEQLPVRVIYIAREDSLINYVTLSDARLAGIDEVARLVPSGALSPATMLETGSGELRKLLDGSRMVIAKGQPNYEGLSGLAGPIFFMLYIKCCVVGAEFGTSQGDFVLKLSEHVTSPGMPTASSKP